LPATGFIGVHLFFFLSGFVIVYPFVRAQASGSAPPSWRHFYYRRAIKIVPSYLISIAIAYALGYNVNQGSGGLWQDLVTHLLFIHTWWPDTDGAINGVLWTLAVEVQFYCIFPFIWWAFKRSRWVTVGSMIAVALAWRATMAHCCMSSGLERLENNLPGFLDIFASGMLCSWLFVNYGKRVQLSKWNYTMPLVAAGGVVFGALLLMNLYDFRTVDQWSAVWEIHNRSYFCVAFLMIAFGWLCSPRWWQVILSNPALRFLGFISYNLYLYHQMIARELLNWHIPTYGSDYQSNIHWQLPYTVLAFALAIAQATIFTYCIERPIMRIRFPVRS
jgi:peptidoglycan/LPS O-acetylase OafA/YrhL